MSRLARYALIALTGTAALIIIALISFVLWSRANSQTIIGAVTIAGVDLEGMKIPDAEAILAEVESRQAEATIQIFVNDQSMTASSAEFGYRVNTGELLDLALWQERQGGFVTRWRRWLRGFFNDPIPVEFHPQASVDETLVENLISQLDAQFGIPPVEGRVDFVNGQAIATYPAPGWLLDSTDAAQQITSAALGGGGTVQLNTKLVQPQTGIDQIAKALTQVHTWVSSPVTLRDPAGENNLIFSGEEIANATIFHFDRTASPPVTLDIDRRLVTRKVAEISDRVGEPPVDAHYEITDDDQVIIHPSSIGTVLDVTGIGDLLEQLAASDTREGVLPLMEGVQPQVTTEAIQELGISHLVSQYTTYHPCCAARVTNIQLFADKVNDALVPPGEEFSLNGHVGRRTQEDGFVKAGTLVKGELVDTIGGGVSQFATTFYNAVFWGGFKDVTHKTHSFYFPRYPEGIEATINWPEVDLVFRNDSSSHVLIRTEYTRTSITVKFFGDNDGRIVIGSWKDGQGRFEVVAEGGDDARVVSARVSERVDQSAPPDTLYRGNPELGLDEVDQLQSAEEGWTVRVTRTIRQGEDSTNHIRNVRYIPRREIIEMHPCVMSLLTESGALAAEGPLEAGDQDGLESEEAIVCPGPEDEEPALLPEGLYERFPELVPEDVGQTPIEDSEGDPGPIDDDQGEQGPIQEEEQDPPDPGSDTSPDGADQ
jgi:vancomycin resistance protein YoaR